MRKFLSFRFGIIAALCGTGLSSFFICQAIAQPADSANPGQTASAPNQETIQIATPDFLLKLMKSSQTVASLQPRGGRGFDFVPADRLKERSSDGYHHLGDLTLRVRRGSSGSWQDYSTARTRKPIIPLTAIAPAIASADLTPTLPADIPLRITRTWSIQNDLLVLRFDLKNSAPETIQIGALSIPMIFNNIITDRSLKQAHEICSFFDPYVGQDGGYLQVTRLNGQGPALIVVPEKNTPFEAYQPLAEPTRPNQTFEGAFAWTVHSQAYAEKEWNRATPWNPPTMVSLAPGETRTYSVRFLLSDQIRNIEKTLERHQRPVVVGIPGYVLPMDISGKLFLNYPRKVTSITVEPKNAVVVRHEKPTRNGWQSYSLQGKTWGRARLTVTYAGGLRQSIHYNVIKPATQTVADLGHFLMTKQWFVNANDPFHRSPSIMSYDRQANKIVAQDSRVWIAGLGDEGGSGSWLAAAMKQFGQPDRAELAKYEQFIDQVLWGGIQFKDGANKYGVRKSLFYYEPQTLPAYPYDLARDWRSWTSWNKRASEDIGRGYNYPHVVAAYWAMYRVARNNPGMVKSHPWDWYLEQAYQTTRFTFSRDANGNRRVGWVELGLMEGDIFLALLDDLKREGWKEKAADVEALIQERAERWRQEEYPFGSEMAWDSTGQEEVYAWCNYFGYRDKAQVSLNSILGYMPTLPHWGYNGNARRYWDFLYGGKLPRIERQIHHYGSGLNAIPVLTEYRQNPDDFYLLRVGYGGLMGALTNIDQEGFASVAFHSLPSTLQWDAYTGDYGPNFFGHAFNTAAYIIEHPEYGWQAFGGNVTAKGDWIQVQIKDSLRKRVFIAPYGLWLTLDAGMFEEVEINTRTSAVRVRLTSARPFTPQALLRIEQPGKGAGIGAYSLKGSFIRERDAYVVPLSKGTTQIELSSNR